MPFLVTNGHSADDDTQGGTGRILEYFGPGVSAQSCTGLATIANMGAEVGATTSTFPYSDNMRAYLTATGRGPVASAADDATRRGYLSADEGAEYDEVIDIVSCRGPINLEELHLMLSFRNCQNSNHT